jgi:Uncharacterized conserved protein
MKLPDMAKINIKRVYEDPEKSDGFRIFADRLWPRGMKKESFRYDLWEKDITPSNELRKWFHEDPDNRWNEFRGMYQKELAHSDPVKAFVEKIRPYDTVTLLYAAKSKDHNHALVLKEYLEKALQTGMQENTKK